MIRNKTRRKTACPCGSGKIYGECCSDPSSPARIGTQKYTPTARFLAERATGYPVNASQSLFGRIPTPRLAFGPTTEKRPIDYNVLARFINESTYPDTLFFLDTNFLTAHEVPRKLWEALFSRTVVITDLVWKELNDWLGSPRVNASVRLRLLQSRIDNQGGSEFSPYKKWHPFHDLACGYYVNLLAARKQMAVSIVNEFRKNNRRDPDEHEFIKLLQAVAGDRSIGMMRKAIQEVNRPDFRFFTDEELTASAIIDGLVRGREVVILTRDKDVQEHFVRLMELMDLHYQGMLFANTYAANKTDFQSHALTLCTEELRHYFVHDSATLVEKPVSNLEDFIPFILPERAVFNAVYCLWLGGDAANLVFTPVTYNAELGMADLLYVKGKTGGLNTDRLDGRNCHVTGFPVGIQDPRRWVIIAEDQRLRHELLGIPFLDLRHAEM